MVHDLNIKISANKQDLEWALSLEERNIYPEESLGQTIKSFGVLLASYPGYSYIATNHSVGNSRVLHEVRENLTQLVRYPLLASPSPFAASQQFCSYALTLDIFERDYHGKTGKGRVDTARAILKRRLCAWLENAPFSSSGRDGEGGQGGSRHPPRPKKGPFTVGQPPETTAGAPFTEGCCQVVEGKTGQAKPGKSGHAASEDPTTTPHPSPPANERPCRLSLAAQPPFLPVEAEQPARGDQEGPKEWAGS